MSLGIETRYINKVAVRELALELAAERGRKFERVSKRFLVEVNTSLRQLVAAKVHAAPSRGITL